MAGRRAAQHEIDLYEYIVYEVRRLRSAPDILANDVRALGRFALLRTMASDAVSSVFAPGSEHAPVDGASDSEPRDASTGGADVFSL